MNLITKLKGMIKKRTCNDRNSAYASNYKCKSMFVPVCQGELKKVSKVEGHVGFYHIEVNAEKIGEEYCIMPTNTYDKEMAEKSIEDIDVGWKMEDLNGYLRKQKVFNFYEKKRYQLSLLMDEGWKTNLFSKRKAGLTGNQIYEFVNFDTVLDSGKQIPNQQDYNVYAINIVELNWLAF